ncbi:kinase-like domain-containing protein [Irpex rosettiformis]|uniref:Kinase-like domain-containing protein n=1 Tax=Irpex rosettiformis TaxID=378272 RepID=A0ACB8UGE2_9APHY|nr:kinase-like domain-containing protein [Irpex rosettiformis]
MYNEFESYIWTDAEEKATMDKGLTFRRIHDYCGRVRGFYDADEQIWILKSVAHDSPEIPLQNMLASHPSPLNHTLPAEVIPCSGTYLILTPFIMEASIVTWESLDEIFVVAEQYLEGLQFMHQLGIAHLDLHAENLMYDREPHSTTGPLATRGRRAYIIDFGLSKQFPPISGLTNGTTVVPFQKNVGHYDPPEGIEAVNPYAYDIYCMGWVIESFCMSTTWDCDRPPPIRVTPAIWALCATLSSDDSEKRPSAGHALALVRLLRVWVKMTRWLYWFLPYHDADGIELCGWRIIDWIVHCSRAYRVSEARILKTRVRS